MEQSTAQRRLVKSPPELWAEVSSEDTLSRHLAQFGEIRITRVQPETTVAWEGERASGTVELAPAGWGTKVILTATLAAPAPEATAAAEPAAVAVQPEPTPEPEPAPEPAAIAPPPHPEPTAAPPPEPKLGFFARLFRRQSRPAQPEPAATSKDPSPPALGPDPPPPDPDPAPTLPEPEPEPAPAPEPALDTVAILSDVLDDLGAAHHRPFSRD